MLKKYLGKKLLFFIVISLGSILNLNANSDLVVTQMQSADWDDGFCNEVEVFNPNDNDIKWKVKIPVNGVITQLWSGKYTQNKKSLKATIRGKKWNKIVKGNDTVNFSYCAEKIKVAPIPPKEGDLSMNRVIESEWDDGFCELIEVTNTTSHDINWKVKIPVNGMITQLWSGEYTQDKDTLETTVIGEDWNHVLNAYTDVEFSYCADKVTIDTSDGTSDNNKTDETNNSISSSFTIKPIKIDQFGYLPKAPKVAVISNPIHGFNAGESFLPTTTYEVRKVSDNSVVFSGDIKSWKDNQTDELSGDQVWHFDFSALETEGEYYIYDTVHNEKSYRFKISSDVYDDVLKQSIRMLFYQRSNFAKNAPYADINWIDDKAFIQDKVATSILDRTNSATQKDVSGGWFDAGDYNKYINYTDEVVHDLLFAYTQNPSSWLDNYNIPESGNGIADILDELRYELEWILKMQVNSQDADGSNPAFKLSDKGGFLHKVSALDFGHGNDSPPSSNLDARYYAPVTTSATISAVGMLAHAATVYQSIDAEFSLKLKNAAIEGWNYLQSKEYSNYDNSGFGTAEAEDSQSRQKANKISASLYLYQLTQDLTYKAYYETNALDGNLINPNNFNDKNNAYFNSDGNRLIPHDAQLLYTTLLGVNSSFSNSIKTNYTFALTNEWVDFAPIKAFDNLTSPYLAFLDACPWGSNQAIGSSGNMLINMITYALDSANNKKYAKVASHYLHYLHGINPQNLVYLSTMNSFGAEKSVDAMHHAWFTDGLTPASGFLVGGAVSDYSGSATIYGQNVSTQPTLKAYASDVDSYQLSEPQLMYQSSYIRLLSSIITIYQ
ncbi:glycoside hydrolase family 9 protein [bacterium]|nr:glycoside hydrolase family 9 protein [bacterium]MBU1958560.1 glycoside hydrolase family 9 protein [bacterium]